MSHPNLSPEAEAQVRAALASRRKIEAIKIYREVTGLGLKESKEAVEAMQRGTTPDSSPGSSPQKRPGVESRGCGPSTAVLLIVLALIYVVWRTQF